MAVSLTPKWNRQQVREKMQEIRSRLVDAVILRMKRIGENFVRNARSKTASQGGFNDRTGNLRNSIGYIILVNGQQVHNNFKTSVKSGGSGVSTGRTVAEEAAAQFSKGIVLIVVAGMDYAAHVEAMGKDVITGSSLAARKELVQAIRDLKEKLKKKAL